MTSPPIRRQPGIPAWPWAFSALGTIPLLLMGLLVWYGVHGVIIFGDVDWYRAGLEGLLRDGPLYDQSKLQPHPLQRPVFFDQAPSTALLSLVLLLPGDGWTWGFLMLSGTLLGLALVWPRVGIGGAVLLAPVLLLWLPVAEALFWGNVNGFVFGLLAVAWRFPRAAGVAVGLAAAIKLVPILAVAWLAGKREWRNVAVAVAIPVVATAIVLVWKGPETLTDFVTLRLNQWTPDHPYRWGLADAGLPPIAGYGVALALSVIAWRRASFGLSIIAMLAALPAMHAHYLTWLLIPLLGTWVPWMIRRQGTPAVPDATGNSYRYRHDFLDCVEIESNGGFVLAHEHAAKATLTERALAEVPTTWRDRAAEKFLSHPRRFLPAYPSLQRVRVPRRFAADSTSPEI